MPWRVTMRITGRVQGVIFRQSARRKARQLELVGNARNNPDGSLEIIAEGERDALEKFITWCRKGPPFARVDNLDAAWGEANGEFGKEFNV